MANIAVAKNINEFSQNVFDGSTNVSRYFVFASNVGKVSEGSVSLSTMATLKVTGNPTSAWDVFAYYTIDGQYEDSGESALTTEAAYNAWLASLAPFGFFIECSEADYLVAYTFITGLVP